MPGSWVEDLTSILLTSKRFKAREEMNRIVFRRPSNSLSRSVVLAADKVDGVRIACFTAEKRTYEQGKRKEKEHGNNVS